MDRFPSVLRRLRPLHPVLRPELPREAFECASEWWCAHQFWQRDLSIVDIAGTFMSGGEL